MDQTAINTLLHDVHEIKLILIGLLVLLSLIVAGVILIPIIAKKLSSEKQATDDLKEKGRELLDKGEIDRLIDLCNEKIKEYPSHSHAHWFLGLAYYRKKEWRKSLNELEFVWNIEPGWREEHIDPYLKDIRKEEKSFKPEVVRD